MIVALSNTISVFRRKTLSLIAMISIQTGFAVRLWAKSSLSYYNLWIPLHHRRNGKTQFINPIALSKTITQSSCPKPRMTFDSAHQQSSCMKTHSGRDSGAIFCIQTYQRAILLAPVHHLLSQTFSGLNVPRHASGHL